MVWNAYVKAYNLPGERVFDTTINEGDREKAELIQRVSYVWLPHVSFH